LLVVIGQFSVTAVDARAHTAASSAGRMVDRFIPRIRIPFTAASPRRVGARSGSRARDRAVATLRRRGTASQAGHDRRRFVSREGLGPRPVALAHSACVS